MRGSNASSERSLPAAARSLAEQAFRYEDVPAVRRVATAFGARAGMGTERLTYFVLAVSEAAACAVAQGPCTARMRLWTTGQHAFCEVHGDGLLLRDGPRGAWRGDAETLRRWVLRQLCDHVSVESGPHGVTVRFSMTFA